jgi:4-hydroxybenzoate polyprenyltransferase
LLGLLRNFFDFLIFSSIYIAVCAVVMVYQTSQLLLNSSYNETFLYFVFAATICSYNFHWLLTPASSTTSPRVNWTLRRKPLHIALYLAGLIAAAYFFWQLRTHYFAIGIGVFATFLYSAPKIPQKHFGLLKRIAVGKTFFLAFVWMYVTTLLPLLLSGKSWQPAFTWFTLSRFFLIYAICILFDYRDRETDKAQHIRSLITFLSDRSIRALFFLSLALFTGFSLLLLKEDIGLAIVILLLIPGLLTGMLYDYSRKNTSDYLYYFVLDGLMMLSALLMLLADYLHLNF